MGGGTFKHASHAEMVVECTYRHTPATDARTHTHTHTHTHTPGSCQHGLESNVVVEERCLAEHDCLFARGDHHTVREYTSTSTRTRTSTSTRCCCKAATRQDEFVRGNLVEVGKATVLLRLGVSVERQHLRPMPLSTQSMPVRKKLPWDEGWDWGSRRRLIRLLYACSLGRCFGKKSVRGECTCGRGGSPP